MISPKFVQTLLLISQIKSKRLTRDILRELAKNKEFRMAVREIVLNLARRRHELKTRKQLEKFNRKLNLLLDKTTNKREKVKVIGELGGFLKLVIKDVISMLDVK